MVRPAPCPCQIQAPKTPRTEASRIIPISVEKLNGYTVKAV